MSIYIDEWVCPECKKVQMVDSDEYLEIGYPMCTKHLEPIEMERVS